MESLTLRADTPEGKAGREGCIVVLLNGRPEIWPAKNGIERLVKAVGASIVEFCANREEALAKIVGLADSGAPAKPASPVPE